MNKTQTFDMNWITDVLEIRPVFCCKTICWTEKINDLLSKEMECGKNDWALLVLDSLSDYFTAKWGEVPSIQSDRNDTSLKQYLNGSCNPGGLSALYTKGCNRIKIETDDTFSSTVIMLADEFQ